MRNWLAFCLIWKVRSKKSDGDSATQQCRGFNGFNGWMLREEVKHEEVKSEEVRGEKEDFSHSDTRALSPSPTLPLSQLKIQNSLTVKCSWVQSHWYGLRNFNLCPDARYFNRHHSPGFCPPHLWLRQRPIADNKMQRTIVKAWSINFWSWLRKNAFDFGNSFNQGFNC